MESTVVHNKIGEMIHICLDHPYHIEFRTRYGPAGRFGCNEHSCFLAN